MYFKVNAGHIGSSLSCVDILTAVYFNWMKPADELILSKGHAAAALYSLLAEDNIISEKDIDSFYQNDTFLAAHPPANKLPKIPFATGSLGHGLSLSAGLGLAFKLKNCDKKVFCVTSDGEINEGSTWEAALFISHHNLNNVIWLIDRNKLQGFGYTEEILKLEPLDEKLNSLGFDVLTVNGHNYDELNLSEELNENLKNPLAIICNTIKGNEWAEYENQLACHYVPLTEKGYKEIIDSIENQRDLLKKIVT